MNWQSYRPSVRLIWREGFGALMPELERAQAQCGDFVRLRLGPLSVYALADPVAIEEVVVRKHANFIRGEPRWSNVRRGLGDGVIVADGEAHRRQRARIQPAFRPRELPAYARLMQDTLDRSLHELEARAGTVVCVNREMMRITMRIISKVLFSLDLAQEADRIETAVKTINDSAVKIDLTLDGALGFLPTRFARHLKRQVRYLHELIDGIVEARLRSDKDYDDILARLLEAPDLSRTLLRDELIGLLAAGHETTANMLSWTWYLLDQNPEAEARLHAELDGLLARRSPTFEDLPKLTVTDAVMRESMRLYPPVWANQRVAARADEIAGHPVPAGAKIFPVTYLVHRDPRWWTEPERFRPERFLEPRADQPRFAYAPFGGGARQCIGQPFAEMEGPYLIAALAQRFRPRLVPGTRVVPEPMITLRPRGGLPMLLERR